MLRCTSTGGRGVYGISAAASTTIAGVWGENSAAGGTGVVGTALGANGGGVSGIGDTTGSTGVYGRGAGIGVIGTTTSGDGVLGVRTAIGGGSSAAIHGIGGTGVFAGQAGYFEGTVSVVGTFSASGAKQFRIDHPLEPSNKYLLHASIESPDVKNLYDGKIATDENGEATVALPGYFEALNRDFRYQLTVLGQFAQAIVATEIAENHFTIKTDKPHVKVFWQVTGIRQDAYMLAHPIVVEQDKTPAERGTYQHPELFGQPEERALSWKQSPALMEQLKAERLKREAGAKAKTN